MHDLGDQRTHGFVHFQDVANLILADFLALFDGVASCEACLDIAFADQCQASEEALLEESDNEMPLISFDDLEDLLF